MFSGLCFGVNYQMEEMGQAMALWGLLWFSDFLNISFLHVYRHSKMIIDHVSGKASINTSFLQGWIKRIQILWKLLNYFAIQHISRSQNMQANSLSKKVCFKNLETAYQKKVCFKNLGNGTWKSMERTTPMSRRTSFSRDIDFSLGTTKSLVFVSVCV